MSDLGPEFEEYAARVRRELVPMMKDCAVHLSIVPADRMEIDIKFAVELGLSIMLDKPLVALVRPGVKIPEKLARVVDRFVEFDIDDPASKGRLTKVLTEIVKGLPKEGP